MSHQQLWQEDGERRAFFSERARMPLFAIYTLWTASDCISSSSKQLLSRMYACVLWRISTALKLSSSRETRILCGPRELQDVIDPRSKQWLAKDDVTCLFVQLTVLQSDQS